MHYGVHQAQVRWKGVCVSECVVKNKKNIKKSAEILMNSVTGATVHKAENIDVILYHYS